VAVTNLEAAINTKAVKPAETFVYKARSVNRNVEHAESVSKRYDNQAWRLQ
jgi:hypothetical protein